MRTCCSEMCEKAGDESWAQTWSLCEPRTHVLLFCPPFITQTTDILRHAVCLFITLNTYIECCEQSICKETGHPHFVAFVCRAQFKFFDFSTKIKQDVTSIGDPYAFQSSIDSLQATIVEAADQKDASEAETVASKTGQKHTQKSYQGSHFLHQLCSEFEVGHFILAASTQV